MKKPQLEAALRAAANASGEKELLARLRISGERMP
jgi:hypothetical protein